MSRDSILTTRFANDAILAAANCCTMQKRYIRLSPLNTQLYFACADTMLSVYVLLGGLSTIVSPCLSSVTNEYISCNQLHAVCDCMRMRGSQTEKGVRLQLSQTCIQDRPCPLCCDVHYLCQSGLCQHVGHGNHT